MEICFLFGRRRRKDLQVPLLEKLQLESYIRPLPLVDRLGAGLTRHLHVLDLEGIRLLHKAECLQVVDDR